MTENKSGKVSVRDVQQQYFEEARWTNKRLGIDEYDPGLPKIPRLTKSRALRELGFVVEGDFRDVTTVQRGQGTTEEIPVTPSLRTSKDQEGNEQVYTVLQPSRSNLRRIAAQHGYYVR